MPKPTFATGDVPSASQINNWMVNIQYVRKASNESLTSNTTFQNDDELVLPVDAGTTYELTLVLRYEASASDMKIRMTGPTGATFGGILNRLHPNATGSGDTSVTYVTMGGSDGLGGLGAGVAESTAMLQGLFITGGTAGNAQLQWAQDVSSATAAIVYAGSYMKLKRLN